MKLFYTVCLVLLSVSHVFASPVQWAVSNGGNGHWYEAVLVPDGITWSNASIQAAAMGGYLATTTSAQENLLVYSLVSENNEYWFTSWGDGFGPWLGGAQAAGASEPDGGWGWITGETMSYTNWGPTPEPNNGIGNEDRICLFGKQTLKDWYWEDLPGEVQVAASLPKGYIVEYDSTLVPEPSSILALLCGVGSVGVCMWRKKK